MDKNFNITVPSQHFVRHQLKKNATESELLSQQHLFLFLNNSFNANYDHL